MRSNRFKTATLIGVLIFAVTASVAWPSVDASPGDTKSSILISNENREVAKASTGRSASEFVQFQFPSCSFNAAMPGFGYQILQQPAPVTPRQQQLFNWFSPWAISRNPILRNMWFPVLVLAGERNARAGAFGIAINPEWFAELDEDVTIGIYAHELGHVSQAYGLIPVDELVRQYGPEGQADYFAGTLLKASRQFTPAQLEKVATWITPSPGDQTHAPGRIRADLMRAGYNNTP